MLIKTLQGLFVLSNFNRDKWETNGLASIDEKTGIIYVGIKKPTEGILMKYPCGTKRFKSLQTITDENK